MVTHVCDLISNEIPGTSGWRPINPEITFRQSRDIALQIVKCNIGKKTRNPFVYFNLPVEIASADVILGGHFGESDKADRVVPSKVYQIMAMAKPMIAGDTSANRELLVHRESAMLTPRSNPRALAQTISELISDPQLCVRLGKGAREQFARMCNEKTITQMLQQVIQEILS